MTHPTVLDVISWNNQLVKSDFTDFFIEMLRGDSLCRMFGINEDGQSWPWSVWHIHSSDMHCDST